MCYVLTTVRDGKLRQADLARYGDFCLSEAIHERLFRVGARAFSDGLDIGFHPRYIDTIRGGMNDEFTSIIITIIIIIIIIMYNCRLNMTVAQSTSPTTASALASVVNNANLHFNNSANR